MNSTHTAKRRPALGDVKAEIIESAQPDRRGDKLLQFLEIAELTTLTGPTLRYLRHKGEGPPMFKLHRRLVGWQSDCIGWIEEQAAKDAEKRS